MVLLLGRPPRRRRHGAGDPRFPLPLAALHYPGTMSRVRPQPCAKLDPAIHTIALYL